jgi:hypothetical protein
MSRLFRLSFSILLTVFLLPGGSRLIHAQELEPPSPEEIDADFHTIRREDRSQDSEVERPAVVRWSDPDGSTHSLDIQVRTRGIFRLARRNCDFPPLRLNIRTGEAKGTLFEDEDKLKLVVTCKLGQDYWEQYVLLEYGAYRTLNLFTDISFRVRLARVTYVDTSGEDDPFTRLAFIIEDAEMLALRNSAREIEWVAGQLDPRLLEKHQAILVDVYQYMIGNTDWSGVEMHNMALIRTFDQVAYTIPYDFDFSGLVNARYAEPDPRLNIRRVRDRLFRGFCPAEVNRSQADYDSVYALFLEKKDEIYEMWRGIEPLDPDRLEDTLEYFDDFYETLSDPRRIEARMIRNCRSLRG